MTKALRQCVLIAGFLLIAASATPQVTPLPGADVSAIYDRLFAQIKTIPVFDGHGVAHILTAYVRAWEINRALRDQGLAPDWVLAIMDDSQRLLARTLSDESRDPLLGTPPDPSVIEGLRRRWSTSSPAVASRSSLI